MLKALFIFVLFVYTSVFVLRFIFKIAVSNLLGKKMMANFEEQKKRQTSNGYEADGAQNFANRGRKTPTNYKGYTGGEYVDFEELQE